MRQRGPQKPEPNCALNYSTPWNGPFFYSTHAFPSELNHCSNDGSTIVMKNFVITLFNHFIWLKLILYLLVVLFYPDISNFTFWNVKIFLIDFLDELGNFKQKNFILQNVKFYNLKCKGRTTQPRFFLVHTKWEKYE